MKYIYEWQHELVFVWSCEDGKKKDFYAKDTPNDNATRAKISLALRKENRQNVSVSFLFPQQMEIAQCHRNWKLQTSAARSFLSSEIKFKLTDITRHLALHVEGLDSFESRSTPIVFGPHLVSQIHLDGELCMYCVQNISSPCIPSTIVTASQSTMCHRFTRHPPCNFGQFIRTESMMILQQFIRIAWVVDVIFKSKLFNSPYYQQAQVSLGKAMGFLNYRGHTCDLPKQNL